MKLMWDQTSDFGICCVITVIVLKRDRGAYNYTYKTFVTLAHDDDNKNNKTCQN